MATKKEARDIVSNIAKKYGYISESDWTKLGHLDPGLRKTFEEAMRNMQKIAARTITRPIGSNAGFVAELLRYADDNDFHKARGDGVLPYIAIHVYPDRMIVEFNGDGLTESDVSAICALGRSANHVAYSHPEAKGIAFKSVFVAAWKVVIQSGQFAFRFEQKRGNKDLGMVIPIWQDADDEKYFPFTRITLFFRDTGDPEEVQSLRPAIVRRLKSLDHTCLLFLRNIERLHVSVYDHRDRMSESRDCFVRGTNGNCIDLETQSINTNGSAKVDTQHYLLARHTLGNVSNDIDDALSDIEEAKIEPSQAEVVLAFPITIHSQPLFRPRKIFAYEPTRRFHYMFIIQPHMGVSADQHQVVGNPTSNIGMADAMAEAFVKAVLQFCEHPTMCYTWPPFLDSFRDRADLRRRIKHRLSKTPVLKSRHGARLRKLDDIATVARDFMDGNDDPLLDDKILDPFLSNKYLSPNPIILRHYGVRGTDDALVIRLLQHDLDNSESRVKSYKCDKWHSALARRLLKMDPSQLQHCKLLPLRDGTWISPQSRPTFLPTASSIPIPEDLPLPVLDSSASTNPDRLALCVYLGVSELSVAQVRASILQRYGVRSNAIGWEDSRSHLHFLYRSHQFRDTSYELRNISVYSNDCAFVPVYSNDVFLYDDRPHSLLRSPGGLPDSKFKFLHSLYFEDEPIRPSRSGLSWRRWLLDIVGLKERPVNTQGRIRNLTLQKPHREPLQVSSQNTRQSVQASIEPRRLPINDCSKLENARMPLAMGVVPTSSAVNCPEHRLNDSSACIRKNLAVTPALSTAPASQLSSYGKLLDKIIQTARAATFPENDKSNAVEPKMTRQAQNIHAQYTVGSAFKLLSQHERYKYIGAAGELYVFELLSTLHLTGWSVENWQSKIRDLAMYHPDYANIKSCMGDDRADIMFDDSTGELTGLLIDQGYLSRNEWQGARPRYYMEVKTTTGRLETPFYMSRAQYRQMYTIHRIRGRSEIYMLLRVYDIEGAGTAVKVYLNPQRLRKENILHFHRFNENTWSITPC